MSETTKKWLKGAAAAFLGATWTSTATALVDPAKFNLVSWAGLRAMAVMWLVAGAGHLGMYLAHSPLPGVDESGSAGGDSQLGGTEIGRQQSA